MLNALNRRRVGTPEIDSKSALLDQYLFHPYPTEMVNLTNTGKSRF